MTRRRNAFTLVEALISLTILSLVLVQLGQLQATAGRLVDRIAAGSGEAAVRARGFRQFSADCAHFVNPGFLPAGTAVIDLSSTSGASTSARLSFYTVEQGSAGGQGIRRVTYELAGREVVRTSAEPDGFPARADAQPERRAVVASGVSALSVQFWTGKEAVSDYRGRKGLPAGLILNMTVEGGRLLSYGRAFSGGVIP